MPRPTITSINPGTFGNATQALKHPTGDTIVVFADKAVWNETKGRYEDYLNLVRK